MTVLRPHCTGYQCRAWNRKGRFHISNQFRALRSLGCDPNSRAVRGEARVLKGRPADYACGRVGHEMSFMGRISDSLVLTFSLSTILVADVLYYI